MSNITFGWTDVKLIKETNKHAHRQIELYKVDIGMNVKFFIHVKSSHILIRVQDVDII